jgi:NitT/TauT family transport system permease protein
MALASRKLVGARGRRFLSAGDLFILLALAAFLYMGLHLVAPSQISGPEIDLAPAALPQYAMLSLGRMAASYVLSLLTMLAFGYIAAHNHGAEKVMMPILDILQSVPLLSFLPVVVLLLTTVLPQRTGLEVASIILIYTGQAWNIGYSFHQSLRTVPRELDEAATVFRMNWWHRLRYLELPFSINGLLWNSVVSWANGWFFLMAAETFRVNERDFRLSGLGSYLQKAAEAGNTQAILLGLGTMVLMVVLLDQLIWQPLLVWAQKFNPDLTSAEDEPTSWFYNLISRSAIASILMSVLVLPLIGALDKRYGKRPVGGQPAAPAKPRRTFRLLWQIIKFAVVLVLGYGLWQIILSLVQLPLTDWARILSGTLATGARVVISVVLGLAWTIPVGVLIGTNARLGARLQSVVQIAAAVPATAFFPVIVAVMVRLPLGLDGAAILLMMFGTQWYMLFNIIAGAMVLPQSLKDVTNLFQIAGWARWRTLILPALMPYIITGMNIASGGAWNASIVAEYTEFDKRVYSVTGLGAVISQATERNDPSMLLAATLTMMVTVVMINRFIWNRLHDYAEEKYRLD